jgi:autotransporter-associated beta strand protein
MRTKSNHPLSSKLFLTLLVPALLVAPRWASALVFGPYTPDANTVYLFHFDEPAGSYIATNAAGSLAAGTNVVAYDTLTINTFPGVGISSPTNFNILGAPGAGSFAFGSFGNAANLANVFNTQTNGLGVDMDQNGGFALNNGTATNFDTIASHSELLGANRSFTFEALVNLTGTNGNQEIVCSDNGFATVLRGFQFRLTGPRLEFNWISSPPNNDLLAVIPTTGPNAFVPNQWFHVAVTHNETPTPGGTNTTFYWTALTDSAVTANAISNFTTLRITNNPPLILDIGNEGRAISPSAGSAEGVEGLMDEVRISNTARAANQMMFFAPTITFTTQPTNQVVATNQTAGFSAAAAGSGTLGYQWYAATTDGTNALAGATNTTLSITSGSTAGATNYFVVVTNGISAPATSSVAILTIRLPLNLEWSGSGPAWDTTSLNWTTNGNATQTAYTEVDNVTFDNLGAAQPTVNVTQTLHPSSVIVSGTASYLLTGAGSIVGAGSLTFSGSGTLTLDTANSYTGSTIVNSGTLQVGDGTTTGLIGTGPLLDNSTVELSPGSATAFAFAGPISGSGSVVLNGAAAGAASLSGSNSFSGNVSVLVGSLHLENGSALGTGATTVAAGAQVYIDANVNLNPTTLTLNGTGIASDGALRKGGGGVSSFGGPVNLAADTIIKVDGGATLNLTNATGVNGTSANANLTLAADSGGLGSVFGPVALGNGGLTVSGGAWTLSNSVDAYDGTTLLSGGSLTVGAAGALGNAPASFNAGQITLTGGSLGAFSSFALNDGLRGVTINNASTSANGFIVGTNAVLTISNSLTGAGEFTKSGPGTLVLNGNNSFSGTLYLDSSSSSADDGVVDVASPNAITGVSIINIRNNNAGFSTLQMDGSNGAFAVSPVILSWNGRNNFVPAFENVTGNNTFSPIQVTWQVGGTFYPIQCDAGTLTVNTAIPNSAPAGFRNVLFSGAGSIVVPGTIQDFSGGTNGIFKLGTGTLTLQAANAYSGGTVISNGVVLVDGSIGNGNGVVTNIGGVLGGVGTVNDPVQIWPGAALSPGDQGIGALTINGSVTNTGNFLFPVNKSLSPSNSVASVSGTLINTGTGSVIITNLGSSLAVGDRFVLFNQPVIGGSSMSVTGSGVVWSNSLAVDGSVSVASLVVPHPVINSVSLAGSNIIISGTNGAAGSPCYLLSSTNLALPLAQWTPVSTNAFDGSGNFSITNAIAPGSPQQFYIVNTP